MEKIKAIHLFAGTGTWTRAFQSQGIEVVWAQEEEKDPAAIYRYNFPQVPFYQGKLDEVMEKIPTHDLLLTSLKIPFSKKSENPYTFEEDQENQIGRILAKHHPRVVLMMLPVMAAIRKSKIFDILEKENYAFTYKILEKTQDGGIPVRGKKAYLIGFQKDSDFLKFQFPASCQHIASIDELWEGSRQKEELYTRVPQAYQRLFENQKLSLGKIYQVVHKRKPEGERELVLQMCELCPSMTARNYRDIFTVDPRGIRRLTAEEYVSLSGDRETVFPSQMSQDKIWRAIGRMGVYAIEKRLAIQTKKALGMELSYHQTEYPLHEFFGDQLLRSFDQFLYKKKIGLLCMPSGTGKIKTLEYLIPEMIERSYGKWKVVILSAYLHTVRQIEIIFHKAGIEARVATSGQDFNDFLTNDSQILLSSYLKWGNFIQNRHLRGFHTNLILFGMEADCGWKYLIDTKLILPQIVYAGMVSRKDSGAEEVFGPVQYEYTLSQAIRDHRMVSVSVEEEIWGQFPEVKAGLLEENMGALTDCIWSYLSRFKEKTVIIAESVVQADKLYEKLEQLAREFWPEWGIYLCVSGQVEREQQKHLRGFKTCVRGVLITVHMWREISGFDVSQVVIAGKINDRDLVDIMALAASKGPGKFSCSLLIFDPHVREKAHLLLGMEEENEALQPFCESLWKGQYQETSVILQSLYKNSGNLAKWLERELGDLILPSGEIKKSIPGIIGGGQMSEQERKTLVQLWLLLSRAAQSWKGLEDRKEVQEEEQEIVSEEKREGDQEESENYQIAKRDEGYKSSAEKGQVLEEALLRLLKNLFSWEWTGHPELGEASYEALEFLQRKPGGTQGGRDLDLVYVDETGQRRRCYFECKSAYSRALKEAEILAKIRQAQRDTREEIEHWILVAPNCRLDTYSVKLFQEAEKIPGLYAPIKNIQVWNEENQIQELMGLEPELYERFFEKPQKPEQDPRTWSQENKQRIIQKWKKKLMPVLMLPQGLRFYPFQPETIMYDLQNDREIRKQYEELFWCRSKLRFYEENGTLSQNYLEENTIEWLESEGTRVRLILGEFGDGKTFFLYCLCRRLLEEFVKNPQKHYLPICISLKNLEDSPSPRDFIEGRMKELKCDYADFLKLKEDFHVLICLDGFDEMSSVIDHRTIHKNIKLLKKCMDHMTGAKILITSRTQCFRQSSLKTWLSEREGGLEVLTLAPVDASMREVFLLSGMEEEKQMEKQEQLFMDGKLFSLMGKPFFLDMMRQLLATEESVGKSAVSIYEHYIRKCLKRKFDRSFERDTQMLLDEQETIERIYHALCSMAYELWQQEKETLSVRAFEEYLGKTTAEVLWEEKSKEPSVREDADHRFSMRTLLKYAGEDRVAFSHRSIREYFVAVYLWKALLQKDKSFEEMMKNEYYNDEILSFLAQMIEGASREKEAIIQKLKEMLKRDRKEERKVRKGKSLSGKIMQLLYNLDKKIPEADWSGKDLSGIYIPGADLSGQSFHHSLFINANLNNVCLDDCDCSYCDMTGVRLEETCFISTLTYERGGLICLYQDGSLRKWNMKRQEEISCVQGLPLLEDSFFIEQGEIFTQSKDRLRVLQIQNGEASVGQEYLKRKDRNLLSVSGQMALIKERDGETTRLRLIHMQNSCIVEEWFTEKESKGKVLGNKYVVIYDGDRKAEIATIEGHDRRRKEFELERQGQAATFDAWENEGEITITFGYSSGDIILYQYADEHVKFAAEGYLRGLVHVVFCGNERLAAVDLEGTIHMMYLNWQKGELCEDTSKAMKLGIYCRHIKTEGLIPESICERLRERR